MKPLTIKELRTRFNKEKPKFIGLKNDKGEWSVPMNNPKIKPGTRMNEIENLFSKESTPDGIYYFISRDSMLKTAPVIETPVAKGTVTAQMMEAAPARTVIQPSPMRKDESVWTPKEAVEHLTEVERLKLQLASKDDELKRFKAEQLEEDNLPEEEPPLDTKTFIDSIKGLAEVFAPALDKYLDTENRKLAIKERQLGIMENRRRIAAGAASATQTGNRRPDGGLFVDDPGYEDYFRALYEADDDAQLNNELDMLEQNEPEIYAQMIEKYPLDDAEEQPAT